MLIKLVDEYILKDFLPYRDSTGLNQVASRFGKGVKTGNGALFTLEYLICLLARPDVSEATKQSEIHRISLALDRLELFSGIPIRHLNWKGYDSMDNAQALLTFSAKYGGSGFAQRMKHHGEAVECEGADEAEDSERNKKFYTLAKIVSALQLSSFFKPKNYWNNRNPGLFCFSGWYGRSPGFLGLIDIAAYGRTTLVRSTSLLIGQIISSFAKKTDLDARKLSYVSWHLLKDRGVVWNLAYKLWTWKLKKDFVGGMAEVYALYYKNEKHPIIRWTQD